MKKYLPLVVFLIVNSVSGQNKIVKEHYTVSGGLLGAVNFNKLRSADNDILDYKFKPGWGAGGWLSIPINEGISFEPQLMYNHYSYQTNATTAFVKDASASYFSMPLILKFHVGKKFAFTAGPQFDFLTGVNSNNSTSSKKDITGTSLSGNIGIEVLPHAKVVPFARYIHGFTNMDNSANTQGKFYNSNIQVGLKLRLFGKLIPGDADGDGIIDKNDKCPTVVGLAKYQGCPIPDTDGDGINDEEDKCPQVPGLAKYQGCPIPDADKDGINDEEDKCPQVPGIPKYQGCPIPDTDKDGVNDEEDKCPQVPGVPKYQGCPIPDTDKDGVNDEEDKCPQVPGVPKYQGCPVPDTDKDGVNDEEDKCPTIAGLASNGGCPEVNIKTSSVQFVTGSATLTSGAKTELNKLVKILNQDYPDAKLDIIGHTDNTGNPDKNLALSVARAESVKTYLASKGVSSNRLRATGFGQDQPIADNTTVSGKAKNRRVEFKVSQ